MKSNYDYLREGFWEEFFSHGDMEMYSFMTCNCLCVYKLGLIHLCYVGIEDVKGQYLIFIGQ